MADMLLLLVILTLSTTVFLPVKTTTNLKMCGEMSVNQSVFLMYNVKDGKSCSCNITSHKTYFIKFHRIYGSLATNETLTKSDFLRASDTNSNSPFSLGPHLANYSTDNCLVCASCNKTADCRNCNEQFNSTDVTLTVTTDNEQDGFLVLLIEPAREEQNNHSLQITCTKDMASTSTISSTNPPTSTTTRPVTMEQLIGLGMIGSGALLLFLVLLFLIVLVVHWRSYMKFRSKECPGKNKKKPAQIKERSTSGKEKQQRRQLQEQAYEDVTDVSTDVHFTQELEVLNKKVHTHKKQHSMSNNSNLSSDVFHSNSASPQNCRKSNSSQPAQQIRQASIDNIFSATTRNRHLSHENNLQTNVIPLDNPMKKDTMLDVRRTTAQSSPRTPDEGVTSQQTHFNLNQKQTKLLDQQAMSKAEASDVDDIYENHGTLFSNTVREASFKNAEEDGCAKIDVGREDNQFPLRPLSVKVVTLQPQAGMSQPRSHLGSHLGIALPGMVYSNDSGETVRIVKLKPSSLDSYSSANDILSKPDHEEEPDHSNKDQKKAVLTNDDCPLEPITLTTNKNVQTENLGQDKFSDCKPATGIEHKGDNSSILKQKECQLVTPDSPGQNCTGSVMTTEDESFDIYENTLISGEAMQDSKEANEIPNPDTIANDDIYEECKGNKAEILNEFASSDVTPNTSIPFDTVMVENELNEPKRASNTTAEEDPSKSIEIVMIENELYESSMMPYRQDEAKSDEIVMVENEIYESCVIPDRYSQ